MCDFEWDRNRSKYPRMKEKSPKLRLSLIPKHSKKKITLLFIGLAAGISSHSIQTFSVTNLPSLFVVSDCQSSFWTCRPACCSTGTSPSPSPAGPSCSPPTPLASHSARRGSGLVTRRTRAPHQSLTTCSLRLKR